MNSASSSSTRVPPTAVSPAAMSWRTVGLVAVGGMLGTGARHGLTLVAPPLAGIPLATMGINIVGAFGLGVLVAVLSRHADAQTRLLWGTGVLGGFTTYSALAVDVVDLLDASRIAAAAAYALGTVVLGLMAAWAGLILGHSHSADVGEDAP